MHGVRTPILHGQILRLDESGVLQIAGLVEWLNAHDGHFVDQVDGFAVVDKRHKRRTIVEKVLNPCGRVDKDIAAENRAVGQRKLGIFANFWNFLVCIQGRAHGRILDSGG